MNKRIFELTVEEFLDILKQQFPISNNVVQAEPATEKKYIYSIKGLAEFLNCSVVTANNLKMKGLIPCKQIGRKVMFDTDAVLAAMHTNKPLKGQRA
jgi:hypothetical protein